MATSYINVVTLDVGQGSCGFVEIYGTGNKLVNTMLFDLGSMHNKDTAGIAAVTYIYNQLKSMALPAKIGLLVLSHKDADHINLLEELLDKFKPKTELIIDMVRFGGRDNWYPSDLMKKLANYCGDIGGFSIGESGYKSGDWEDFWEGNDVQAFLLVANTPMGAETSGDAMTDMEDKPSGERVNAKSAVCSVYYKGCSFIMTGDATFTTIEECNVILNGLKLDYVQMMTLPHHAARKTTFGLPKSSADISLGAQQIVDTFAGIINAKTLIASADTMHHHPSLTVIDTFAKYADKKTTWYSDPHLTGNTHLITAFIDLSLEFPDKTKPKLNLFSPYMTFVTGINVYSTLYCYKVLGNLGSFSWPPTAKLASPDYTSNLGNFPYGGNWTYQLTAKQQLSLSRSQSRASSLTAPSSPALDSTFVSREDARQNEASLLREPPSPRRETPLAQASLSPTDSSRLSRLKAIF